MNLRIGQEVLEEGNSTVIFLLFRIMLVRNYLLKSRSNDGFTLIELLVVIVIVGVLAAIALPSFLTQASKAREAEAKTYIGSINRAQQAYYHEKLSFADSLDNLGIGVPAQTGNYQYQINAPNPAAASEVIAQPIPGKKLKAYRGCVAIINEIDSSQSMKSGGPTPIEPPNAVDECAPGSGTLPATAAGVPPVNAAGSSTPPSVPSPLP